jgi:hypothetical protein
LGIDGQPGYVGTDVAVVFGLEHDRIVRAHLSTPASLRILSPAAPHRARDIGMDRLIAKKIRYAQRRMAIL